MIEESEMIILNKTDPRDDHLVAAVRKAIKRRAYRQVRGDYDGEKLRYRLAKAFLAWRYWMHYAVRLRERTRWRTGEAPAPEGVPLLFRFGDRSHAVGYARDGMFYMKGGVCLHAVKNWRLIE